MVAPIHTPEQRAVFAEKLSKDFLFNEALMDAEKNYVRQLVECDAKDDTGRRHYAEAIKIINIVKAHIVSVVRHGELSASEASAMSEPPGLAKRVVRLF